MMRKAVSTPHVIRAESVINIFFNIDDQHKTVENMNENTIQQEIVKIFSHIKYFLGGNVLESLNLFINPKFDINTHSKGHMAPLIQNHGMFLSHIYTYTVSKNKSSYFIIKFFF